MARPSFKPTDEQRKDVRLMKTLGWSDDRIADRLSIARDTLTKHFGAEIRNGADDLRIFALRSLVAAAEKGSVSASKEIYKIASAGGALDDFLEPPERAVRVRPKGRKEVAHEDAINADPDGAWGNDLVPASLHTVQ